MDTKFFKTVAPLLFYCVNDKEMGNSRVLEWGKDLYVVYRSFLYGLFEMKGHAFFMTCDFAVSFQEDRLRTYHLYSERRL